MRRKKAVKRHYNQNQRDLWFSLGKRRNALLREVLDILEELKIRKIEITEENIKSRLSHKPDNVDFWLVLRIALYELDLMNGD